MIPRPPFRRLRSRCAALRRARRGLTVVEMMVASAVGLIVITAAASALIQTMRMTEEANAYLDAVANARVALRDMSFEIKQASLTAPAPFMFTGTNAPGAQGDRIDNDGDGAVDEDRPDGVDEDGVYTDRHATIATKTEREGFVGVPDLGDGGVDDDPVFDADSVEFRLADGRNDRVKYSLGAFDGEEHVLLREIEYDVGDPASVTVVEPVAFDVLGLNILYWDENVTTGGVAYWTEEWDHTSPGSGLYPDLALPASVYLTVTVYSGWEPLETLDPATPLDVVTLNTMANIESVITHANYIRPEN